MWRTATYSYSVIMNYSTIHECMLLQLSVVVTVQTQIISSLQTEQNTLCNAQLTRTLWRVFKTNNLDQSHISPRQRPCVVGRWCRADADTRCTRDDHSQRSDAHTLSKSAMYTHSCNEHVITAFQLYCQISRLSTSYRLAQKKWKWLPFHQFCLICTRLAWNWWQHRQTNNLMYIAKLHRL